MARVIVIDKKRKIKDKERSDLIRMHNLKDFARLLKKLKQGGRI